MGEKLELWLVRHGETTRSVRREIAGWTDPPLTERGREQARALRPFLDGEVFTGVWSSDLQRTVTTSRLAWGHAQPDRRLREVNFGDLEGQHFAEVDPEEARRFMEFRNFVTPGGENRAQFEGRITAFLDEVESGRHLIFTHGGVIRLLTQDLGVDKFLPTCSVAAVDWTQRELLFVREPEESAAVFESER